MSRGKNEYVTPALNQLDLLLAFVPSTLGCSNTHNNTLQVLQRTIRHRTSLGWLFSAKRQVLNHTRKYSALSDNPNVL
jgi:hypothetical protein